MELSLEHYTNDQQILQQVLLQLQKDIVLCGGHWESTIAGDARALKKSVEDFLLKVALRDKALLFNLLYRIDVPQQYMDSPDLADIILKRELYKVLMRKKQL